jgi:lambda family phage portal protein
MTKTNTLDRFIGYLSPGAGARRMAERMALDQIRTYDAAQKNRRTSHWNTTHTSADAEIIPALEQLRGISRGMVRNNTYAFQAIEVLTTNVIGAGIRASITSENAAALKKVKKYWKDWFGTTECDFMSQLSGYGIQSLSTRSMFESGECLIVRRKFKSTEGTLLPIRLQILEPDFIDTHKYKANTGVGNYISQGIEYNDKGQRVAYWLFDEHPGNLTGFYQTSKPWPAEDIIHLYRQLRPGQERGVPAGVSAFVRLNDFDDYESAELMRQKIASCFAVFISGSPSGLPETPDPNAKPREKVAPGIIERLKPGETVMFAKPPSVAGYGEYSRKSLQGSAAGYGVTYEALTGDFSNTTFSSGRLGGLGEVRKITELQNNTIIPKACERMFKWFLDAVYLVEGYDPRIFSVDWTPPRREMIDIVKETKAIIDQILAGTTTFSEAARENGWAPDDLIAEIKSDQEKIKKAGITLTSDATKLIIPPTLKNIDVGAGDGNAGNSAGGGA